MNTKLAQFISQQKEATTFAGRPSSDVRNYLADELDYTSKPTSFGGVSCTFNLSDAPANVQSYIHKMSPIDAKSLFGNGKPSDKFSQPIDDQFILCKDGGKEYLIDTQGYDYARYIIKLQR